MKKIVLLLLAVSVCLVCCCCEALSPVKEAAPVFNNEELQKSDKALKAAKEEAARLQEELNRLENEHAGLKIDYKNLSEEYAQYREKMNGYEDLSEEEAQARKIEADRVLAEQKAKEEAEAAVAKAEQEAKEKLGYETGITYYQLSRTPDDFKGEKVKFSGRVLQVLEGDEINSLRLAVNNDYTAIIYCFYDPNIVDIRILENDRITIYGTTDGLYTYDSVGSGPITLPLIYVDKIDL